jgi:hypothetical protein
MNIFETGLGYTTPKDLLNNSRNIPNVADESCLTKNQVDLGVAPPNPKSGKSLEKY